MTSGTRPDTIAGQALILPWHRTQEGLWDVPVANEIDLNDAVAAARGALPSWKSVSIEERQDCLLKLAEETEKRKDELCYILARECGKSVWIH